MNDSTLATVPSAQLANTLPPHEAIHIVGSPGEPAFENGAHNIPTSGEVPLPPGFRPAAGKAAIFEQLNQALALVFDGNTHIAALELSGKVLGNEEKRSSSKGSPTRLKASSPDRIDPPPERVR